ncbi:MAG: ATP-binding cassette domain-containing protein [Polyangiaceae bacterium]|nr:ATP-binding cassette domain-containing protein [Polyangiaceae bacterium]
MIEFTSVSARGRYAPGKPHALLRKVSLTWRRGLLAVVGSQADGTSLLLDVAAGATRVREGRVLVLGQSPRAARTSLSYVSRQPLLPDALRVDEVCELAAAVRAEPATKASERLAPFGIESLAKRKTSTLAPEETKAVALAIATTSRAPLLLVDEPLSGIAPQAASRAIAVLRDRAASSCVVVTTASVRDATNLADQLSLITQGAVLPLPPAFAHVGPAGALVRVVVTGQGIGDLAHALKSEYGVATVIQEAFVLAVVGPNLVDLAAAVARASVQTRVNLDAIEPAVLPLEAVRASLTMPFAQHAPFASSPPPNGPS